MERRADTRVEKDFLGEESLPSGALYGIHSVRAKENFPDDSAFPVEWYQACGTVKLAVYISLGKFRLALENEDADLIRHLRLPGSGEVEALKKAAGEVAEGRHFGHFIVPAVQGGAGTSINLNINEIITNSALHYLGKKAGDYEVIDPIEDANIFQSTNDVIPTALTLVVMRLLGKLEEEINRTRAKTEGLESRYRNSLRLGYTQMQEAVPSTFGQLFSTYNEALSRDWWRVSKAFERIKLVNLGGGATGTGIGIPRFFMMDVVPTLKKLCSLPLTQGENLQDATCNLDKWVEVHAILKAHAVNMEKMASDLRLLSTGTGTGDISLPPRQVGSSIMPGKVNPVIPEFIISSAHKIYANDQLISSLSARGCLELNAYLPQIGVAVIESLRLMMAMNRALREKLLKDLNINEEAARERLYRSVAVCTALSPLLGYHKAAELAAEMKRSGSDIFLANKELGLVKGEKLEKMMEAARLLKKGFTLSDIRDVI